MFMYNVHVNDFHRSLKHVKTYLHDLVTELISPAAVYSF